MAAAANVPNEATEVEDCSGTRVRARVRTYVLLLVGVTNTHGLPVSFMLGGGSA